MKAWLGRPVTYPLNLGDDPIVGPTIHLREYTAEGLATVTRDAGFTDIHLTPFWFGLTMLSLGLTSMPSWLQPYSQYLFIDVLKPTAN